SAVQMFSVRAPLFICSLTRTDNANSRSKSERRSITRWSSRLFFSFLLLLLTFFSVNLTTRATEDEPDDYDVKARVVRISLISGEVTLKRKGNSDWERARLNFPLVEGDTVSTDRDS